METAWSTTTHCHDALDPSLAHRSAKYPLPQPKEKPRPGRHEFGDIAALTADDINKCPSECRYGRDHDQIALMILLTIDMYDG